VIPILQIVFWKSFSRSNRVYQFVSVLVIDGFSENSFEV